MRHLAKWKEALRLRVMWAPLLHSQGPESDHLLKCCTLKPHAPHPSPGPATVLQILKSSPSRIECPVDNQMYLSGREALLLTASHFLSKKLCFYFSYLTARNNITYFISFYLSSRLRGRNVCPHFTNKIKA